MEGRNNYSDIFLEQKKETGSDKNITDLNHYFVAWKGRNNYSDTHTKTN